jgi:hypothetical protein
MTTPIPAPGSGLAGIGGISGGSAPGVSPLSGYGITQQGLMSGAFQSRTASPNDMVNVGKKYLPGIRAEGIGYVRPRSGSVSYQNAQGLPGVWYNDNPGAYKEFINKAILYKIPKASPDMGVTEAMDVWDDLLQTAIGLSKSTGRQWSPWDVLESYNRKPGSLGTSRQGDWLIDNASGERVKYVGPKTKTTTGRSIDLSSPEEVQALTQQVLTQMIGRAPTDKELAQFKTAMNAYERDNPEVTTTTETYNDMGEVVSTDQVRSGGASEAALAGIVQKDVKDTKEYGKYQGGTTLFNALLQMVGGS